MMFTNIKLSDEKYVECTIDATKLSSEQLKELIPQPTYTVKGDFSIIKGRIFLSELIAIDDVGHECRLVESEGIDYVSLEDYIENVSDAYKWYAEYISENEEREQAYWQDRQAEWYDRYGRHG